MTMEFLRTKNKTIFQNHWHHCHQDWLIVKMFVNQQFQTCQKYHAQNWQNVEGVFHLFADFHICTFAQPFLIILINFQDSQTLSDCTGVFLYHFDPRFSLDTFLHLDFHLLLNNFMLHSWDSKKGFRSGDKEHHLSKKDYFPVVPTETKANWLGPGKIRLVSIQSLNLDCVREMKNCYQILEFGLIFAIRVPWLRNHFPSYTQRPQ